MNKLQNKEFIEKMWGELDLVENEYGHYILEETQQVFLEELMQHVFILPGIIFELEQAEGDSNNPCETEAESFYSFNITVLRSNGNDIDVLNINTGGISCLTISHCNNESSFEDFEDKIYLIEENKEDCDYLRVIKDLYLSDFITLLENQYNIEDIDYNMDEIDLIIEKTFLDPKDLNTIMIDFLKNK